VAAIALLIALWRAAGRAQDSFRIAVRTALVSLAVLGLSANIDVFTLSAAWIWPLAAAAMVVRRDPGARTVEANTRHKQSSLGAREGGQPSGHLARY
jgi:hypothetical protein